MFYTGIGSRSTPKKILKLMKHVGYYMSSKNIILRSGGDAGAEAAFQSGCQKWCKRHEISFDERQIITIPADEYNGNKICTKNGISKENHWLSYDISIELHPNGKYLTTPQINLIERSVTHIYGTDGVSSTLLIYWNDDKNNTSETDRIEHSIRLAKAEKIPIFNLKNKKEKKKILMMMEKGK